MSEYLVLQPCAYVNAAGDAVQHVEAGVVAEIPDDVASELGDAVQPLAGPGTADPVAAERVPDAKVTVDGVDQGPGRRGRRPADAHPGEVVGDGDG
jgi:hypothetical protein